MGQHLLDQFEQGLHAFVVELDEEYNMQTIEIETDIQIPDVRGMQLPLSKLGIGHSFFVGTEPDNHDTMLSRIRTRTNRYHQKFPTFKFSIFQVDDPKKGRGIRVFRIKSNSKGK